VVQKEVRVAETEAEPGWPYEGWAILELMGHRKLGGYMRVVDLVGAAFVRIDVPEEGAFGSATQFYASAAIYAITPTTEETARALARGFRPEPVTRWELPPAAPPASGERPCAVDYPDLDSICGEGADGL
jgi:hypothetical protein